MKTSAEVEPCARCGSLDHDEPYHWCDHCGQVDDACTCWMLDPIYRWSETGQPLWARTVPLAGPVTECRHVPPDNWCPTCYRFNR